MSSESPDRLPPFSREAERCVLGSMLRDNAVTGDVLQIVRAENFYAAVRAYWPALRDGDLAPAYAGVRPKLSGPGEAAKDFLVEGPADHGAKGVYHLLGIESPGLTSCLAIAAHVAALVTESGFGALYRHGTPSYAELGGT